MKYLTLLVLATLISFGFKPDMLSDCTSDGSTYYSVEEALADVANAKKLDIAMNKLKTIDPNIAKLKNLECLDLSFNTFSDLPSEMAKLEKLSYLNIAGTRYLAKLPEVVFNLKGLKVLDVQDHPEWPKTAVDEINKRLSHVKIIWAEDNTKPAEVPGN